MNRRNFLSNGAIAGGAALSGAVATGALAGEAPAKASGAAVAPLPVSTSGLTLAAGSVASLTSYPQQERFRIGYTSNTRGGWEGNPWKGITEAREVGFRYFEIFGSSFSALPSAPQRPETWERIAYFPDDAEALMIRMHAIGASFVSVTGGRAGGATAFHDPTQREAVIENHFSMTRFSRRFGCMTHKTNLGSRRAEGTTDADLREMAITCNELGRRITEELGVRFGIHPHLGSQLQNEHETTFMLENTDPSYVGLILDTGHITMAGMDPLALARRYGHRVLEYHLKDVKAEDLGGTKNVPPASHDMMAEPYFFPLGSGGVNFLGLKTHLESIDWRGVLNVELDTSPWRAPKQSARMSAEYLVNTLGISL